MRLIDADALEMDLVNTKIRLAAEKGKIFDMIAKAPTIDPESLRPTGEWRYCGSVLRMCGECGAAYKITAGAAAWDYCPSCGAKMN